MTELEPCPFCGGEAEIHPSSDWDAHLTGATYFAWCDKCETRGNYYNTEKEAAEAWNTRAERTCEVRRHGRLEGMVSFICFSCSVCGYGWHTSEYDKPFSYCPNCGAKVVDE